MQVYRAIVLLLLAQGMLACEHADTPLGNQPSEPVSLSVTAVRDTFINGGLAFRLSNSGTTPIYVDRCRADLQQRDSDGGWRLVAGQSCSKNPVENSQPPIVVTGEVTYPRFWDVVLQAGQYRAIFYARHSASDTAQAVNSNTFQVIHTEVAQDASGLAGTKPLTHEWYSGIHDEQFRFITNAADWDAWWKEAYAMVQPVPPTPAVDFNTTRVVAVSMGVQPTGGYDIRIVALYSSYDVLVDETAPGSNCAVTQALTAPVHAIEIPKPVYSEHVHFVLRHYFQSCA